MPDLAEFRTSLDGELFSPDSSGYEAIRRPVNVAYREVRPRLVVLCRSVSDVVGAMTYATATGDRIAPRGGGHCFAGRSSTDGIVLDMSGLDGISVADDRVATIRAGARLGQVYAALHAYGRTLPAGCGPTVGITGLTPSPKPSNQHEGETKERRDMSKVFSAHAVSVDGYISGRTPDGDEEFGRGLGDASGLFGWYTDGDTPSQVFGGFRLSEPSARFFDAIAARVGAVVAGRTTYEHSGHWGGGGPHPAARLFVLSHRPAPEISETQTLVTTGIEDAVAAAREAAGGKDVALMGGGVLTSALEADLVDEVILHQVPVLLGAGRSFFHKLPAAAS